MTFQIDLFMESDLVQALYILYRHYRRAKNLLQNIAVQGGLGKIASAVRESGVSWHNGDNYGTLLNPQYDTQSGI